MKARAQLTTVLKWVHKEGGETAKQIGLDKSLVQEAEANERKLGSFLRWRCRGPRHRLDVSPPEGEASVARRSFSTSTAREAEGLLLCNREPSAA